MVISVYVEYKISSQCWDDFEFSSVASGVAWRGGRVGTELNGCILDNLGFLMSVMNLRAGVEQEAGHTGLELQKSC